MPTGDEPGVDFGASEEHQRGYDPETESPAVVVAQAAAEVLGRDQADLPPLYDTLDPDALDALLGDGDRRDVAVSFTYSSVAVTVTGDGAVTLRPQ